jgi:hypothetical protein
MYNAKIQDVMFAIIFTITSDFLLKEGVNSRKNSGDA